MRRFVEFLQIQKDYHYHHDYYYHQNRLDFVSHRFLIGNKHSRQTSVNYTLFYILNSTYTWPSQCHLFHKVRKRKKESIPPLLSIQYKFDRHQITFEMGKLKLTYYNQQQSKVIYLNIPIYNSKNYNTCIKLQCNKNTLILLIYFQNQVVSCEINKFLKSLLKRILSIDSRQQQFNQQIIKLLQHYNYQESGRNYTTQQ
eukprot:TRINITY_DN4125_c0_g1_i2.p2 TRINITY_DN4125_c0_g1~~TRINITY_DN4125_c0_g1_i2.p2  ORF type:complete len:199 (+),score=-11.46 TRINITY_DN4125_c0_g1_i2:367-963(+)